MIAAVDTDSPREVFFRVAAEMFSDGNFNWGRVVALFYFASKLVLKVGGCRALSPGRLPSGLRGPGSYEVNPSGQPRNHRGNGDSQLWAAHQLFHSCIYSLSMGFPSGSDGKESTCKRRRPRFDPWVGKIPW